MLNLPKALARQLDERAEEIAALKEALECERATWRRHWKERDQAALAAERQLAETCATLEDLLDEYDKAAPRSWLSPDVLHRVRVAIHHTRKGQGNADHS